MKIKKSQGFTIVETMIFLAVSGFMFAAAAVFINGKQASVEFKQGMNNFNTQIQGAMDDVANNNYASGGNFKCTPTGMGPSVTTISSAQGTNIGCDFVGKVIQFAPQDTNGTGYNVYTLAGNQYVGPDYTNVNGDSNVSTTLAQAMPVAVDPLTEQNSTEFQLQITKVIAWDNNTPQKDVGAVGFFNSGGSYNSNNQLNSGAQNSGMINLYATNYGQPKAGIESDIKANLRNYSTANHPNPQVLICLKGGNGQYGSITIGSSGGILTTDMNIDGSSPSSGCPS